MLVYVTCMPAVEAVWQFKNQGWKLPMTFVSFGLSGAMAVHALINKAGVLYSQQKSSEDLT